MMQRRTPRFAVQLPVSFSGDEVSGKGTILNLSTEGCAVLGDATLAKSNYLALQIDLPGDSSPLIIELAAVRWCSGSQSGLEFIRLESTQQERLQAFVKTLEVNSEA